MNNEIKEIIESKFPVSDVTIVSELLKVINKNLAKSRKPSRIREIETILTKNLR